MFRGFKLSANFMLDRKYASDINAVSHVDMVPIIEMIKSGEPIDARRVANKLFPQGAPDIFLSHSFADRDKAVILANAMQQAHGLKVFIDSEVWGSVYDLLKEVDNEYCWQRASNAYSYEKRNQSTAHVYMILNSALHEVIDRAESFIFLGSDKSLVASIKETTEQYDEAKTYSPWIHSELLLSSMIRRKQPERYRVRALDSAISAERLTEDKQLIMTHEAPLNHLQEISQNVLRQWLETSHGRDHGLDVLYNLLANK